MTLAIAIEPPRQPELLELLTQSDEFTFSLYPPDSCYLLDVTELERPNVTLFAARLDGAAVGIAALVDRGDGSAELKRMFVSAAARGQGVAGGILRSLEAHAAATGITLLQLETGPLQPEAIALYEKHGYTRIPNFGQYAGDEFSVCYEKRL
ncbi:MAG: putative acetyltransferase [Frankiales bacterium]|nr:putative acetyltransferase [Frankiales bacterium]